MERKNRNNNNSDKTSVLLLRSTGEAGLGMFWKSFELQARTMGCSAHGPGGQECWQLTHELLGWRAASCASLGGPSPSSIPAPCSLSSQTLSHSPLSPIGLSSSQLRDQGFRGPVIPLAVLCLLMLKRTSEPCTGGVYCTLCGKNIQTTHRHRLQHSEGLGGGMEGVNGGIKGHLQYIQW